MGDRQRTVTVERGQAHTLEGVVAGLLLLSSLVFALQVTTVTPLSASTSSQHIENQQRSIGAGVLASAEEEGALRTAVLFWNETGGRFHDAGGQRGYSTGPPNEFGSLLNRSLRAHGIAFNIDLNYLSDFQGGQKTFQYVDQGYPSDNAVTIRRSVVLTDDDVLYHANGTETSKTLKEVDSDTSEFLYVEDVDPDSPFYNIVTVEVTIWRI